MKIVVTEEIETVGWDTAMADAPKAVSDSLRAGSKAGSPVVAGRLLNSNQQSTTWVVVDYSSGQPVVIERATVNPTVQP